VPASRYSQILVATARSCLQSLVIFAVMAANMPVRYCRELACLLEEWRPG
jgi:hypothetical protein